MKEASIIHWLSALHHDRRPGDREPVTGRAGPEPRNGRFTNVNGTVTCGQPANCKQYIQWVISHPDSGILAWTPGTTYDYSNFGYCVLGATIEKVTGTDYATWVTNNILTPNGARDVHIGQTLGVQDREVSYYHNNSVVTSLFDPQDLVGPVPAPYGNYYVEGSPASGGWSASTIDWLRFQAAIDGRRGTPLLTSELGDVYAYPGPPGSTTIPMGGFISGDGGGDISNQGPSSMGPSYFYGAGWDIHAAADSVASAGDWTHSGFILGTSTIDIHMSNGFGIVGFLNDTTNSGNYDLYGNLYAAFNAANGVNGNWFSQDLFDQYASYTGWMTGSQYQAYFDQQVQTGLYPARIEGINHFGTPMFRAAFARSRGMRGRATMGSGARTTRRSTPP